MSFQHLLNFSQSALASEQQAFEHLAQQLAENIDVIVIDGSKQQITFQRLKQAEADFPWDAPSKVPGAVFASLQDLPAEPVCMSYEKLNSISMGIVSDIIWVLPLPHESAICRWLLIVDKAGELSQQTVENHFLTLGWSLTSLQLHLRSERLHEANAWIQQELEEMSRVQQLMLPDDDYAIPGTKIAFKYQALKGAGGDYLDFVSLESDKSKSAPHQMGMIVADVTGHGPSAAVEAAMLDAILRTYKLPDGSHDPADVLNYINQHFFTRKERGSFLTMSILHYCPVNRIIQYANAGHPHTYLKRGSSITRLDKGGIPVGVLRDYQWQTYKIEVQQNDTLFAYTDVIIETKNVHEEDFGFERLEDALRNADDDPEKLIAQIEQRLMAFCHCQQYEDDLTMCAVQFTE